jgi:hypothetical protein
MEIRGMARDGAAAHYVPYTDKHGSTAGIYRGLSHGDSELGSMLRPVAGRQFCGSMAGTRAGQDSWLRASTSSVQLRKHPRRKGRRWPWGAHVGSAV